MAEEHWFGPYRLEEKIGMGQMGEVWKAFHPDTNRHVAIKVPLRFDGDFGERFQREAWGQGKLIHEHIVRVHNAGVIDGRQYIDMQLVEGRDLGSIIEEEGPIEPGRALEILRAIASAIDFAHDEEVLHRDIKPSNILVDESQHRKGVYLSDFSVADIKDMGLERLTETGFRSPGTRRYQPVEIWDGGQPDRSSDVFAFGCTAFETLAGDEAFRWTSQVFSPDRPRISDRVEDLECLDDILGKALSLEPEERYRTCPDLVAAIESALSMRPIAQGEPITGSTVPDKSIDDNERRKDELRQLQSLREENEALLKELKGHSSSAELLEKENDRLASELRELKATSEQRERRLAHERLARGLSLIRGKRESDLRETETDHVGPAEGRPQELASIDVDEAFSIRGEELEVREALQELNDELTIQVADPGSTPASAKQRKRVVKVPASVVSGHSSSRYLRQLGARHRETTNRNSGGTESSHYRYFLGMRGRAELESVASSIISGISEGATILKCNAGTGAEQYLLLRTADDSADGSGPVKARIEVWRSGTPPGDFQGNPLKPTAMERRGFKRATGRHTVPVGVTSGGSGPMKLTWWKKIDFHPGRDDQATLESMVEDLACAATIDLITEDGSGLWRGSVVRV